MQLFPKKSRNCCPKQDPFGNYYYVHIRVQLAIPYPSSSQEAQMPKPVPSNPDKRARRLNASPQRGLTPRIPLAVWESIKETWHLSHQQLQGAKALCRNGKVNSAH